MRPAETDTSPASNTMDKDYLHSWRRRIDIYLDKHLPSPKEPPHTLHHAIRYSALANAKRIRPILALAVYETLGGEDTEFAMAPACALELVHTYSLIHDDLPCMDNDDLRRGLPTLHRQYGEGIAVLAGDALHDLAFSWTAQAGDTRLVLELAEAIGSLGMIGGQVADMEAEGREVNFDEVTYIHTRKTGALIRCAVRFGAIMAKCDERRLAALTVYGEKIGLAFQIVDDILDVMGDQSKLGKKVGSDEKNNKATYPAVVGMESAHSDAARLMGEAIAALSEIGAESGRLEELARYICQRDA